jgi:hypothetical protein
MNVLPSTATPVKSPFRNHQSPSGTSQTKKTSKMKVAPRMLMKTKGKKKRSRDIDENKGVSLIFQKT